MGRAIYRWRYGDPPYTFVWQETSPDPDAVVVDAIVTEFPTTDAGMPTISVSPTTPTRSYRGFGNGGAPYVAQPNATNIFDIRVDGLAGADGFCELAGGEYWTDANFQSGDYVDFAVVDKDDTLGYFGAYGLNRNRLIGLTGITGTFQVGETVTGAGGASGKILAVGSDFLIIQADFTGTFAAGEALTGGTSGAAATLGSFAAGDVLELKKYVKKRPCVPSEHGEIAPGGASRVLMGLYLRTIIVTTSAGTDRKYGIYFNTAA